MKWKKRFGFTLIELMVVLTVIAILVTMSTLAYTGYIRSTRDTQRMADIATLNTILLDIRRSTGQYPAKETFETLTTARNRWEAILDPLDKQVKCLTSSTEKTADYCGYIYYTCDNGEWYALSAKFETTYNAQKYTQISNESAWYYTMWTCTALDLPTPLSVPDPDLCRTKADCQSDSVCVWPPPRHCRPKNNQGTGASCDVNDECLSNKCKKKVCE